MTTISDVPCNSEITIHLADGTNINVDSRILVQQSTFFRHLLDPRFTGDHINKDIYITDYESCTVRHLIRYIVDGELIVTRNTNIAQLLALCDLMCMPSLYSIISGVFDDVLCDRNCFQILEFTLQRDLQELTKTCWKYIFNQYPYIVHPRKTFDWKYKTLIMTFTNEYIRFIETSTIVKYFKYWSIVNAKRHKLLRKVIHDILKENPLTRRCILELLECLVNLYDTNSCVKLCNEGQKLNLLVIGGHLDKAEDFYNDKFVPHNEFHEHIQLGYSIRKSIPNMKNHRVFSASAMDRNGIYIVGGRNIYGDLLDSVEYYEYDVNTWRKEVVMEQPKMLCAAVCMEDKLYVSGGCDVNSKVLKTVYIYLAKKNIWKRIADLTQPRVGHQMCSVFGVLYVIGGQDDKENTLNSVEFYDTFTNKWIPVSSMNSLRWRFGVAVIKKSIFVFGGIDSSENTIGSIEKYDTSLNVWSVVTKIQGIYDMGVAVYNKNIYLCGGNTNNGATNLIQIFHSESGVFRIVGQLKIKRSGTTISVLPDNELFFYRFCSSCDSVKYVQRCDMKLWQYPSIKRNAEQLVDDHEIVFDAHISLR